MQPKNHYHHQNNLSNTKSIPQDLRPQEMTTSEFTLNSKFLPWRQWNQTLERCGSTPEAEKRLKGWTGELSSLEFLKNHGKTKKWESGLGHFYFVLSFNFNNKKKYLYASWSMNTYFKIWCSDFYNSTIIPFNSCHSNKFEVIIRKIIPWITESNIH